ncbi:hypothetical protein [Cerasicoccus fimbriatus]|uniref:hypothetical protein n=1 Tax=Cerasicoccus fimbriatus TaxID=3014554 RepID=UPI0022B5B002|nr:hypothetical protein [Cerasicoccus sp. TK19100]
MKGLSIALRIIAILGAAAAAFFWYSTNGKVKAANEEIAAIEQQKKAAESQIQDLEAEKMKFQGMANDLDQKLADANSKINFSSNELNKLRRDINRQKDDYQDLEKRYSTLDTAHEQLKVEISNVQKPDTASVDPAIIKDLETQIETLQSQVGDYKDKIDALNYQIKNTASAIPSGDGSPVTLAGGPVGPVKEQDASILRTDMDRGILIISRGQVDGMQKEMQFDVAKGFGKKVRVKVGTVAPTYSVAYVLPGQDPSHLQEGDPVNITQ